MIKFHFSYLKSVTIIKNNDRLGSRDEAYKTLLLLLLLLLLFIQ